ncbi:hypothetical protein [Methanoregula sp.]|jgi:hypothetical protein|uniref:hypothetical protein n=1 Tax=Methanoregula sp. TaxID=2052170 RepID=UPI00262866A2|nr:hypothetical protein [Methanoregula sp.]MDD5143952.1 hypothetical protein [Methanoregula sp.]
MEAAPLEEGYPPARKEGSIKDYSSEECPHPLKTFIQIGTIFVIRGHFEPLCFGRFFTGAAKLTYSTG